MKHITCRWTTVFERTIAGILCGWCALWPAISAAQVVEASAKAVDDRQVSVEALLSLKEISGLSLSPDGEKIAFQLREKDLERNAYKQIWMVAEVQGGRVGRLADGGGIIGLPYNSGALRGAENGRPFTFEPSWSPDGRYFAFVANTDGDYRLWITASMGRELRVVSQPGRDLSAFVWSADGRKIHYQTGPKKQSLEAARKQESLRGFLLDERFIPGVSKFPMWIASSDADSAAVWTIEISDGGTRSIRLAASKEAQYLESIKGPSNFRSEELWLPVKTRDHSMIVWAGEMPGEGLRQWDRKLRIAHIEDDVIIDCLASECMAGSDDRGNWTYFRDFWWSSDNEKIFFAKSDSVGFFRLYEWRVGAEGVRLILETKGELVRKSIERGLACENRRDQALICVFETATQPARIVSISLADGSIETIFDPNTEFGRFPLPSVIRLQYTSPSGVEAWGYWVEPQEGRPGEKSSAVVVQYDCEGFLLGGTGDEVPIFVLATAGVGVFCHDSFVNVTSSVSEKDIPGRRLQRYRDNVDSIDRGLEILIEDHGVDPDRVGITGFSNGAELLHFALINSDRKFAASAASYGSWEPSRFFVAGEAYQNVMTELGFGYPGSEDDRLFDYMSVRRNAAKIQSPLLIQVSESEMLFGLSGYYALKRANKPVEWHIFSDEWHVKRQPAHLYHLYRRYVQWFKFWLQGEEVNDPVDSNQYARWRKLRELHEANTAAQSTKLN